MKCTAWIKEMTSTHKSFPRKTILDHLTPEHFRCWRYWIEYFVPTSLVVRINMHNENTNTTTLQYSSNNNNNNKPFRTSDDIGITSAALIILNDWQKEMITSFFDLFIYNVNFFCIYNYYSGFCVCSFTA